MKNGEISIVMLDGFFGLPSEVVLSKSDIEGLTALAMENNVDTSIFEHFEELAIHMSNNYNWGKGKNGYILD